MIKEFLRRATSFVGSARDGYPSELGSSIIPSPLYEFLERADTLYAQATEEHVVAQEQTDSAWDKWGEIGVKGEDVAEKRSAYEEYSKLKDISSQKWQATHEVWKQVDAEMRNVALYLVKNRWRDLTVMERRAVDIQASDHQLSTPLIHPVLAGLHSGQRIGGEAALVHTSAEIQDFVSPGSALYGYCDYALRRHYMPDVGHLIGSETFGRQRALAQHIPEILPDLLHKIPQTYTINRKAVATYLKEVVSRCRAHIVDSDGIGLALEPHLEHPYSDAEWRAGLAKQKETAPHIAAALAKDCPTLIALTVYGPITRKKKNYVMFHPLTGVQMGACFLEDDSKEIDRAIAIAHETGKHHGVKVETGTGQGGVFGGAFYTWNFATEAHIAKKIAELDRRNTTIFGRLTPNFLSSTTVEQLLELQFQLLDGDPLVVKNAESFRRVQRSLQRYKDYYSDPIFQRARFLSRSHL